MKMSPKKNHVVTRTFLLGLLGIGLFWVQAAQRPNVLVILADDQGWGDVSIHGNKNFQTPHLDALAKSGALFEYFYVCPLCAPTRAEFLTGRYHRRSGVYGVSRGAERLNLDETTIAQDFQAAGYATAIFGKWHNGTQYPYHPLARGFEEFYGFTSGHWGLYFSPILEHNGHLVRGKGYIADDLTDHAIRFIEQHRNQPFFCYLAYNTPHFPLEVPDRFYNRFRSAPIRMRNRNPKREDIQATRGVLAMVENIDWNVGRLLARLHELGLDDHTIVVYFSDNGPNTWRWNGGMRGKKGWTDEGGVRVPCFIRWPGHIRAGLRIPQIAGAIDLRPTLTELAGISMRLSKPLDGVSLKPLLLEETTHWPDRYIISQQGRSISIRTQRFRLDDRGRLYDMEKDLGQQVDVSKQYPQIAARLRRMAEQWKKETALTPQILHRPFTVGYPEFPVTFLPARDGVPHGEVRRSGSAPNCSFFTHWISKEDYVTWDIQVHTSGIYEVTLYYTCPVADVGSTIEISFLDSRPTTQITVPFDPPLHGMEYDRIPRRVESYVKDFRPLDAGRMHLKKRRGLLTVRPLKVPGRQVMDLWMVQLKLVQPDS